MQSAKIVEETCNQYFKRCDQLAEIPTAAGLRVDLGLTRTEYGNLIRGNDKMAAILKRANARLEAVIIARALAGKFNATFSTWLLKTEHGFEPPVDTTPIEVKLANDLLPFGQ